MSGGSNHESHKPHGAIAQLGERLPCKQEVSGSIPLGSTKTTISNERSDYEKK